MTRDPQKIRRDPRKKNGEPYGPPPYVNASEIE